MKKLIITLTVIVGISLLAGCGYAVYSLSAKAPEEVTNTPAVIPLVGVKDTSPTRSELLKLINAERKKVGVAPLVEDKRLDTSAQRKADDMVKYNYFGHVSTHDGRHGYTYIFDSTKHGCKLASENIVWGHSYITANIAVDWWMHSAPHRKALQNKLYTLTGFGIVENKVVEHFCQPV